MRIRGSSTGQTLFHQQARNTGIRDGRCVPIVHLYPHNLHGRGLTDATETECPGRAMHMARRECIAMIEHFMDKKQGMKVQKVQQGASRNRMPAGQSVTL